MIQLDKQELQAIMVLKMIPEFKIFVDILNKESSNLSYSCASTKDEILLRWNQGRYQEILDILTKIKTADEELRSYRTEARKHVE